MAVEDLKNYEEYLLGCRFCPMCKPAAEVANVTYLESHTTRARAMMLWRVASGAADFTKRDAELLYQSTLDSISEAWCVSHYPVSKYMVAARALVYQKGLVPETVRSVLDRNMPEIADVKAKRILLASEAYELGDKALLDPVLSVLENVEILMISSGAIPYLLGAIEETTRQAKRVVDQIRLSGAEEVVADGPVTLWALRYIYPLLGMELPGNIKLSSITEALEGKGMEDIQAKSDLFQKKKVLFHDSRCSSLLADEPAQDAAIQPGYRGPEETMGKGEVYEAPRKIIDASGMERIFTVWTRSLSRSCGADDGLWLTYPGLAEKLGLSLIAQAEELGAEIIVTDSLLCSEHLKRIASDGRIKVLWLPEIAA